MEIINFPILYEDSKQKIYLNSSKEIFVQNKVCGTTLRMQTQTDTGIKIACDNIKIKACNYHAVSGLHLSKEK